MRQVFSVYLVLVSLQLVLAASGGAQILINNGSAPPDPANVISAASPDILVRNVGCSGTGGCGLPGAATTVEATAGAEIVEVTVFDTSQLEVSGGVVGDPDFFLDIAAGGGISVEDSSGVTMTGGLVERIDLYESATVEIRGGTLGYQESSPDQPPEHGSIWARGNSFVDISGGTIYGDLSIEDSASAHISGTPLPYSVGMTSYGQLVITDSLRLFQGVVGAMWGSTSLLGESGVGRINFGPSGQLLIDADPVVGISGTVGTISGGHSGIATLRNGTLGTIRLFAWSSLNIEGGIVDPWAHCSYEWDGCSSESTFDLYDESQLSMSGGTVRTTIRAMGMSTVEISGGTLSHFEDGSSLDLRDSSRLDMSGGSAHFMRTFDASMATIRGGSLTEVYGTAGSVLLILAEPGSTVLLDGIPVSHGWLEADGDRLTGTLESGGPLDLYLGNGPWGYANYQGGVIVFVPEPAQIIMLCAGILLLVGLRGTPNSPG